jgi:putative transposase
VLHLIRSTFRFASKRDWDKMSRDLRPVYPAVSVHEAKERFVDFTDIWGERWPAVIRLWENAWAEFVPFLDY